MSIARAIDVGFGQVKYTTKDYDAGAGCQVFPSITATATGLVKMAGSMFGQDDVVNIDVDGKLYTVGPDAINSVSGSFVRNVDDTYSRSNDYMALLRGALYYMREPEIDWLVVGLPVSTYKNDAIRDSLRERIIGAHTLPNFHSERSRSTHPSVSVRIAHCRVVPQPAGAFFNHCSSAKVYDAMGDRKNLIIDIGHGTVDWFVASGLKMEHARCGAYAGGMSQIISVIAAQMGDRLQNNIHIQTRIDRALRNNSLVIVDGEEKDLNDYRTVIDEEIRKSVKAMLVGIRDTVDIDKIIVTGGGASLWQGILQDELKRKMIIDADPVFSNVRGFQFYAEQLANPVTA